MVNDISAFVKQYSMKIILHKTMQKILFFVRYIRRICECNQKSEKILTVDFVYIYA